MKRYAKTYYENLIEYLNSVVSSDRKGNLTDFNKSIEDTCKQILLCSKSGGKLIFIGNGASAAISSHMSTDFWKNGGIRAVAFNDSSLLTCISNDYGYEYVFEKPIEMFAGKGDILIAISSSGRSENILRGVKVAKGKGCHIITLSGFDSYNPLFRLGDINFYVPSNSYGPVEIIHHSICHCILDTIMQFKIAAKQRGER